MQFSVGDIVVHPHHGPGRVAGVERWDVIDEGRQYYIVEIPAQGLILHIPVDKVIEAGMRPAIAPSRLPTVLSTLRSQPRELPNDYKERQEQIDAVLKEGQILPLACAFRDLTWHGERAHLTKKDSDLLRQVQDLLAAEIALVSGDDVSDSVALIASTLAEALAEHAAAEAGSENPPG
jgi:CarD family transcriptional regulator